MHGNMNVKFVCSCAFFLLLNFGGQDATSVAIGSVLFYTYYFMNNLLCKEESYNFKCVLRDLDDSLLANAIFHRQQSVSQRTAMMLPYEQWTTLNSK